MSSQGAALMFSLTLSSNIISSLAVIGAHGIINSVKINVELCAKSNAQIQTIKLMQKYGE